MCGSSCSNASSNNSWFHHLISLFFCWYVCVWLLSLRVPIMRGRLLSLPFQLSKAKGFQFEVLIFNQFHSLQQICVQAAFRHACTVKFNGLVWLSCWCGFVLWSSTDLYLTLWFVVWVLHTYICTCRSSFVIEHMFCFIWFVFLLSKSFVVGSRSRKGPKQQGKTARKMTAHSDIRVRVRSVLVALAL